MRACLTSPGGHPEMAARADALLWSINERLAGRAGLDVMAPTLDWVDDLTRLYSGRRRTGND